jgi:glycosyltransferase involved in cell wall biosynthesis
MVLGLRGVIDVQGGVETHARMLYPRLARLGCAIEILQRSPYFPRGKRRRSWRGMRLSYLWSPTIPGLETAVHSLIGLTYAAIKRPDILHLHAVGPGFLAPFARCLGLRVVVTHHAPDYLAEKWGRLAKGILRTGEWLGMRFANHPITVSAVIQQELEDRYAVAATVIPNGVPLSRRVRSRDVLDRFGLASGRYVLCVARLDPTKRQHELIAAFERASMSGWKLVLTGDLTQTAYAKRLRDAAARNDNTVLTGYQTGRSLRELYAHAGIFVLASSHEGHPIALLEALSYGVPALASSNEANLAIPLPHDHYFPVGDTLTLARLLSRVRAEPRDARWDQLAALVRERYSWARAARRTKSVYESVSMSHIVRPAQYSRYG